MIDKSRIEQTFDKVAEFPGQKAGFYAKELGFEPGYQLMTLFAKNRVVHTGVKRNFHYYTIASAPPNAIARGNGAAPSLTTAKKKKPRKKPFEPRDTIDVTSIRDNRHVEIPLEAIANGGRAAMFPDEDVALLGALIVSVANALKQHR